MTRGQEVFHQIQSKARTDSLAGSRQPPTADYLTRHALESFLDRLTDTDHGQHFVLKGGILLAAYGARRPTKDVDAEAIKLDSHRRHHRPHRQRHRCGQG